MSGYAAKRFIASSPEAQVKGQIVLSFLENIESALVAPLLPKYGLEHVDPDGWYSQQTWLNVLSELNTLPGMQMTLVAIGRKAMEHSVWPPNITTLTEAMHMMGMAHHMNFRNVPQEEGFKVVEKGPNHLWLYQNTPEAPDAAYGLLWGLAARFKGQDETFVVRMMDNPNPEETPGNLFEVKWGSKNAKL